VGSSFQSAVITRSALRHYTISPLTTKLLLLLLLLMMMMMMMMTADFFVASLHDNAN